MSIEKYQESERRYQEDGRTYRIIAKYGMHYIKGNRVPYFFITGSIDERVGLKGWSEDSGGCIHDEIAKHFPELKPLIQFHLWGQDGIPMHYVENAVYWWKGWKHFSKTHIEDYKKFTEKQAAEENYKIFNDHICLFPNEVKSIPEDENTLREWLKARQPRIQQHFLETMQKFNIEFIEV